MFAVLCGLAHQGYVHTILPDTELLRLAPIQKPYQIGLMFTHIRTVIPEWFLKPRSVVIESPERTQDSQKQTLSNIFPTKNALQLIPITHDEVKRWEILKTLWRFRICRFYGETVHVLFFDARENYECRLYTVTFLASPYKGKHHRTNDELQNRIKWSWIEPSKERSKQK